MPVCRLFNGVICTHAPREAVGVGIAVAVSAAAIVLGAVAALLQPAFAQGRYPAGDGPCRVSNTHVLENQTATEFVKRGDEAAAKADWAKACYNYQEALERYPNHVVPAEDGIYVGLASRVSRALCAMPPEGQRVYRSIYDKNASLPIEWAAQQKDTGALLSAALKYPIATDAPRALALASALQCESGNIAEAIGAYGSIAGDETAKGLTPEALARLAVALKLAGNSERLGRLAAAAAAVRETAGGKEKVRVCGKDVSLSTFIKELACAAGSAQPAKPAGRPAGLSLTACEWGQFFGGPARDGLMPPLASLPPLAWNEDLPVGATRTVEGIAWFEDTSGPPDISAAQRPVHNPVVGLGTIFLHNDLAVWAYNIVGPEKHLLWKYENTRLQPEEVMDDERVDHTSTLANGRLFVSVVTHVGQHETRMNNMLTVKYPIPRRALLAFDAGTEKLLWQLGGQPGTPQFPGAASFPHAPAAHADGLLFAGGTHALYSTDPPDHYVFCIEPVAGKVCWSTFIGSAMLDINLFNNPTREVVGSPVTVWQDLVFYCANVGVVAALDKGTGRIVWLRRYEHVPTAMPRDAYMPPRRPLGWCNSPPLVVNDALAVTPMDSPYIFLFDARTGKELAKRTRGELRNTCGVGDLRYMLGAKDGMIFVSSPFGVVALSARPQSLLSPAWTCRLGNEIANGRGALTDTGLAMPCETSVLMIDTANGKILKKWQWQRLGAGQLGCNIVVMQGMVVAASSRTLRVYYSQQALEQGLAEELAAAPNDPEIMYYVANNYLRSRKKEEGIALLEKAAALAARRRDRAGQALEQRCRLSLFDSYMASAELAAKGGSPEARPSFESAKRWAPDAEAFVLAALKLAQALRTQGALQEAAAQFSEVIVKYPDAQYESMRAADFARTEIANLLGAHGRALYAPIENQAAAMLETARKTGSHQMFLSVFRYYPNSKAAETALVETAAAAAKTKRWDDVIESLQLFLRHFPTAERALDAHMQLLEAYEAKEMLSSARSILRTMVLSFPNGEIVSDGEKVSVRDFAQTRLNSEKYKGPRTAAPAATALAPPLSRSWQYQAAEGTDLRVLLAQQTPADAAGLHPDVVNRVFLATADTIVCLDAVSGSTLWELPTANGVSRPNPCLHERYLLVASNNQVLAVNAVTGMEAWTRAVENYVRHLVLCDGLVYATAFARESPGDLRVFAFDANTGATVWEQAVVQPGVDSMVVVGDYLAFSGPNLPVICVYDRLTGAFQRRIQLVGRVNSVVPIPASSALVVVSTDHKARRIDLSTGREQWSQTLNPPVELGEKFAAVEGLFIYFLQGTPRNRLVLIDLDSGKMRMRRETATDDLQRGWWLVNGLVYASFTDRARNMPYVQAFELLQGEVRMQFTPEVAHRNSELRPIASGEYLIFGCYSYRREATPAAPGWAPTVYIVEAATGRAVQTLDIGEFELSQSPPAVFVVSGTLLVQQAQTISAFRGK